VADTDKSKSSTPLPWVVLTGLLGVFAVGNPAGIVPSTSSTSTSRSKVDERTAENARLTAEDNPLNVVADFHKSHDLMVAPDEILRNQLHGYKTEFLIATVPDPIDSPLGFAFDQVVDSIQRGIQKKNGYLFDRCWLPWDLDRRAKPKVDAATAPKTEKLANTSFRERFPGVLLFRHGRNSKKKIDAPSLCVVFLVGETPLKGIHKQAFHKALQIMTEAGHPVTEPIRMVGPYFTGSQTSLQFALADWWKKEPETASEPRRGSAPAKDRPAYRFDIICGNASAIRERDYLNYEANKTDFKDWPKDGVGFSSTVLPTRLTLGGLLHFLDHRDGTTTTEPIAGGINNLPGKVALLTESNTGFGNAVANLGKDNVVFMRFPLHISRVKTEYSQAQKKIDDQNGIRHDPLSVSITDEQFLEEGVTSQGGATTTSINGQQIAEILATISRERCRYVGVIASDTRDKLFLIRLIRDNCPDVRIFVTDGDLLLSHPDYRSYMRGVIVGSTYPLIPRNQNWVDSKTAERFLFPSVGSQGYYNAVLKQLGLDNQMIEYSAPTFALRDPNHAEDAGKRPPIWISMIAANGSVVPLHLYTNFEDPNNPIALSKETNETTTVTGVDYPGSLIPIAIVLLAWWGYLIFRAWFKPFTRLFWKGGSLFQFSDFFYRNIVLGSQILLGVPILCAAWAHAEMRDFQSLWSNAIVGTVFFCMVAIALGMLKPLFRVPLGLVLRGMGINRQIVITPPENKETRTEIITWVIINALIFAIIAIFVTVCIYRFEMYGDLARRTLFFIRAVDLSTGVSPLNPLFFLCIAYSAWAFFQLKRSHISERFFIPSPYPNTNEFRRIHEADAALRNEIQLEAIAVNHFQAFFAGGAALVGFGIAVWLQSLPTVEGWSWDLIFFAGFAGLFILSMTTLIRLFYLWKATKGLLDAISAQPMMRSFIRLPSKITDTFGKYFFSQRPQLAHLQVPAHQLRLLADAANADPESPPCLRSLAPTAQKIQAQLAENLAPGVRKRFVHRAEREVRDQLNVAASFCLSELAPRGRRLNVDDAFGTQTVLDPAKQKEKDAASGDPAWVPLAESVAAAQVILYISQFFAQLRNLVVATILVSSLLLVAATSYPFHPEKLLLIGLICLSGGGIAAVLYVLLEMSKDEVVSRVLKTTPGKLDMGFISSIATYVIPALGVGAAQLSGSFRTILEPLFRVMK
jgi:hypothetical protein